MVSGVITQHIMPQLSEEEVSRGITYVDFCKKFVTPAQGPARPTEAIFRGSWLQQVELEGLFSDFNVKFFAHQVRSPSAFYHWHPELLPNSCKPHTPYSRNFFYAYRPQNYSEREYSVSMINGRGETINVPDFSLFSIDDLHYVTMVGKWFKKLNPRKELTPSLAFYIWAGIAFNIFHFVAWEEKVKMVTQVNKSAAQKSWGSKFVKFRQFIPVPESVDPKLPGLEGATTGPGEFDAPYSSSSRSSRLSSATPSLPDRHVQKELRESITAFYVKGIAQSLVSTLSSLDSDTPTNPAVPSPGRMGDTGQSCCKSARNPP